MGCHNLFVSFYILYVGYVSSVWAVASGAVAAWAIIVAMRAVKPPLGCHILYLGYYSLYAGYCSLYVGCCNL